MKKLINNKSFVYFLFFIFIMSLVKIDYRFNEIEYGKSVDDAEYYYNALTLAVDYDLDYSNQMEGVQNRNLNIEDNQKIVPFHPIGSGLLGAPFLIFSNLTLDPFFKSNLISFNYFVYSLIPIFYFFISIKLIFKTCNHLKVNINKPLIFLFILGTGVSYYAFDRFSMSHIYEFFSVCLVMFLSSKVINSQTENKYIYFILGLSIYLFLTIRFTNYFLIIIPALILIIQNKNIKNIYFNIYFLFGNILGIVLFLMHTKYLYGMYTFNQADIVLQVENSIGNTYASFFDLSKFGDNLLLVLSSLNTIFFSQEFGLFFFAPIIFIGLGYVFLFLIQKRYSLFFLLGFSYLIPFFSVIVLQNTAFSYGFRYLFVLIPLNIIIYFKFFHKNKLIKNYLTIFSFLGLIGYLFFETTQYTSLSQDYLINSFGMDTRYSNPQYLSNLYKSILNFGSYVHIIFTSFIGVVLIKILNLFTNPLIFFAKITTITPDVERIVENSIQFSWIKLVISYIIIYYFFNNLVKKE